MRSKRVFYMCVAPFCLASLSYAEAFYELGLEQQSNLSPRIEITGGLERTPSNVGLGGTQVLIPLTQLKEDQSDLWFGHAQVRTRTSTEHALLETSFELGTGYRLQLNPELQIGGYGLVDLRLGASKNTYWLFTPGAEIHTPQWHLNLTGYIPLGKSYHMESKEKFGHELGIQTDHRFEKHQEFDHSYKVGEALPMGIDLNGSWQLNEQFSVSVGGYYMQYAEQAAYPGMRAGIAYTPTPSLRFETQGYYDKAPKIVTQLHFSLGHVPQDSEQRLTAPIQRPFIPMKTAFDQGEQQVRDHIDFYSPQGSSSGDGSFETPYGTTIDQTKVTAMQSGASIYLAQEAEYTVVSPPSNPITQAFAWVQGLRGVSEETATPTPVDLLTLSGTSLRGRSADFKTAASEAKRPVLRVPLQGSGQGTPEQPVLIEDIRMDSSNSTDAWKAGISLASGKQVQIQNVESLGTKIKQGLTIYNSKHVKVLNSTLFSSETSIAMNGNEEVQIVGNTFGGTGATEVSISGGKAIQITDNSFDLVTSTEQLVGLSLDSTRTQLKIQGNEFIMRAPIHWTKEERDPITLLGIKGMTSADREIQKNNFTFDTKNMGDISVLTITNGETLTTENPTHTDKFGNKFNLILR